MPPTSICERLIRAGHRVAVCEQIEDPAEAKKRGAKSVVRRDVVRLVTPGTLTEDTLLEARKNNYLAALARVKADDSLALAWADISSGEFVVMPVAAERLAADLAAPRAGRDRLPDAILAEPSLAGAARGIRARRSRRLPASRFDSAAGERRLKDAFRRRGARWLRRLQPGRDRQPRRAPRLCAADPGRPRARSAHRRGAKSRRSA